tara:strand:- start:129 stop:1058 length:930 start_codon:yes stop_codon:yes gene_type:complete
MEIVNPITAHLNDIIRYSIEDINKIETEIDTILDQDIINKLLEIKKNNKSFTHLKPVKLKYSMITKTAETWKQNKKDKNREEEHFIDNIHLNLNKLSGKLYTTISNKIIVTLREYGLEKARKIILDLIFNKSITEKQFANLYCKLCLQLIELYDSSFKTDILEKSDTYYSEHVKTVFIKKENITYDEFCDNNKLKKNIIGIFIFVAYLYINDIISSEIILKYIDSLFTSIYNSKEYDVEIYCICELIPIVGKKIEQDLSQDDFSEDFNTLIVDKLRIITQDKKKYKSKYRFLILNVLDLQKTNWVHKKK